MKFFSAIASSVITSTSFITGSTVQAFGQWPTRDFYSARAVAVSTRSAIPQFPVSIPEFYRVPGRDFWNKSVSERGQVRTFGNGEWQSIHEFPNTMNGCHNGVFLLRWRSSNGPVLSAVGWSKNAEFKANKPASYGYMYGTNCQMPLFNSVRNNHINNVIYEIFFYQAGV